MLGQGHSFEAREVHISVTLLMRGAMRAENDRPAHWLGFGRRGVCADAPSACRLGTWRTFTDFPKSGFLVGHPGACPILVPYERSAWVRVASHREPGQDREVAAISGLWRVPGPMQVAFFVPGLGRGHRRFGPCVPFMHLDIDYIDNQSGIL